MKKSILVVDDSETIRHQLRDLLEQAGYVVLEADNGQAGVNAADGNQVDLVICDVNMPIMNGIDMVSEVRRLESHRVTPIFMLTTESSRGAAQLGKQVGATAWLVKPVNPGILLKGIKKVLAS